MSRCIQNTAAVLLVVLAPGALLAAPPLDLPAGAETTISEPARLTTHDLPLGPWEGGELPVLNLTGRVSSQAWRLPGTGADTQQVMERLRKGLAGMGYLPIFACASDACGGFDFRYGAKIFSEPEMHIDLSDFRFLAATRGRGDEAEYLELFVSRAGSTGFVQLTSVGTDQDDASQSVTANTDPAIAPPEPTPVATADTLAAMLEQSGSVVLEGLTFASGAATLGVERPPALAALAAYLKSHPQARVIIVGHTDASGSQAANANLSRLRAQTVAALLQSDYGVDAAQLSADGAGALAPVSTNLTEAGRQKNRRVEAVLASTR